MNERSLISALSLAALLSASAPVQAAPQKVWEPFSEATTASSCLAQKQKPAFIDARWMGGHCYVVPAPTAPTARKKTVQHFLNSRARILRALRARRARFIPRVKMHTFAKNVKMPTVLKLSDLELAAKRHEQLATQLTQKAQLEQREANKLKLLIKQREQQLAQLRQQLLARKNKIQQLTLDALAKRQKASLFHNNAIYLRNRLRQRKRKLRK